MKTTEENLETTGGITLNLDYWDCECDDNYIHFKARTNCSKCGAIQEDQPSSRSNEVKIYSQLNLINY